MGETGKGSEREEKWERKGDIGGEEEEKGKKYSPCLTGRKNEGEGKEKRREERGEREKKKQRKQEVKTHQTSLTRASRKKDEGSRKRLLGTEAWG